MTRWARIQSTHRTQKTPEEATPWNEFQQQRTQLTRDSDDKPGESMESAKKGIHREPDKQRKITDEERRKLKKEKVLKRMREEREKKGQVLLPEKIEKKIYRMKKAMRTKGKSAAEIKEEIRQFRRKEELAFRKQCAKACLHCREPGHMVAQCPKAPKIGICYRCGASDHTSAACLKAAGGAFKFAACFVCGEQGHISRECPKNDKGAFPKGGGCRFCGSNKHKKQDCPDRKANQRRRDGDEDEEEIVADVIRDETVSAEAEVRATDSQQPPEPPSSAFSSRTQHQHQRTAANKAKVVRF